MHEKKNVLIKRISCSQQCHEAFDLAVKVFMEFVAPYYPADGVDEFRRSLKDPEYIGNLCTYAAFDDCHKKLRQAHCALLC